MPRQQPASFIAYPAILPYPLLSFLGSAFKWFLLLTCSASVPYSLYTCSRVIEQVVHKPIAVHTAAPHRQHTMPARKGANL